MDMVCGIGPHRAETDQLHGFHWRLSRVCGRAGDEPSGRSRWIGRVPHAGPESSFWRVVPFTQDFSSGGDSLVVGSVFLELANREHQCEAGAFTRPQ